MESCEQLSLALGGSGEADVSDDEGADEEEKEEWVVMREKDRVGMRVGQEYLCHYFEDDGWYNAVLDEIQEDGSFLITFTEYFNQEKVTLGEMKKRSGDEAGDEGSDELLRAPIMIGDMFGKVETKLVGVRQIKKKKVVIGGGTSKIKLKSELDVVKQKVFPFLVLLF